MCVFPPPLTSRLGLLYLCCHTFAKPQLSAYVETFTVSHCGRTFDMRAVVERLGGNVCVVMSWMSKDNQQTEKESSEIESKECFISQPQSLFIILCYATVNTIRFAGTDLTGSKLL